MRPLLILLACAVACAHPPPPLPPPPGPSAFALAAEALLEGPAREGALVGAVVLDERTGQEIYSRAAHTRGIPASTLKLLATATALAELGPDYRFRTPVFLEGTQAGAVFLGDLVVEASGDPSLGSWRWPETDAAALGDRIAGALKAKGIQHLTGALVVRGFEPRPDALLGPGWAWDDLAYDYGAAPLPFSFRENVVDVTASRRPSMRCDEPARVTFAPFALGYAADVRAEAADTDLGFACTRDRGAKLLRCSWRAAPGTCPRQASLRAAIDEPAALFASVVTQALARANVAQGPVPGDLALVAALPAPQVPLISVESPPLSELVRATNKDSLNLYADRLMLTVVRARAGAESFVALAGVARDELATRGIDPREISAVDGSGLSRYNQATPWGLAKLLQSSLQAPGGAALVASLPIVGVDGTLAKRGNEKTKGLVRAKSGSMTAQRAWVGLAERPGDPARPRVVFAIMLGNQANPTVSAGETFDRFVEALVTLGL